MNADRNEAGFSLVELLVAMLVTMIISGAIFTLLNAGQGAFRRQPELTDRQQNIRQAMDLIQRDIATAGAGMDPFEQAFSRGDGPNETGTLLDGAGLVVGPSGLPRDILEVMGADASCNDVPSGLPIGGGGNQVDTAFDIPECFPGQPPQAPALAAVALTAPVLNDTVLWGLSGPNGGINVMFTGGQPVKSDVAIKGLAGSTATKVIPIQLARYAILDDAQLVPNLWRSGRGGLNDAGALTPVGDPAGQWQLIARGIEDLQVRYRMVNDPPFGGAGCCGSPPQVVFNTVTTLVQEVEVTLWARTLAPNLQGQTTRAGVTAIHGSLVTVTTPRAVLMTMNAQTPPLWR